jgi:hypothetical protein
LYIFHICLGPTAPRGIVTLTPRWTIDSTQRDEGMAGGGAAGASQQGQQAANPNLQEQRGGSDVPRSADTGSRSRQGNLGTTQREWSGTSPQDMGEDG